MAISDHQPVPSTEFLKLGPVFKYFLCSLYRETTTNTLVVYFLVQTETIHPVYIIITTQSKRSISQIFSRELIVADKMEIKVSPEEPKFYSDIFPK